MAIGATVTDWLDLDFLNNGGALLTGFNSRWVPVCTDPGAADNGGAVVVNPYAIARSAQHWLQLNGLGTTVQLRLRYKIGAAVTTNPVIQCFGRDKISGGTSDSRAVRLVDASLAHALTLAVDDDDVNDGTYQYTQLVEVDAQGNVEIIAAVKTLAVASDLTDAQIEARVR